MFHTLFLLAAVTAPQAQLFDDWAVACDNVRRCEATALQAPEQFGGAHSQVLLTREAGPAGTLDIAVDPADPVRGPVALFIDGEKVETGTVRDNYRVSGVAAERLARLMRRGKWLEMRSGARRLGRISLQGFAATIAHIDAQQGRIGKSTALSSMGGIMLDASEVPAATPLPSVPALRAFAGPAASPTRALLGALAKFAGCDLSIVFSDLPVERYSLDGEATLMLIPCGTSAYNFNTAAFILRGGKGAPAEFDTPPDGREGDAPGILTNASFSTVGGAVLTSSAKGRGVGDCGSSQRWVWDGSRFRMIEARMLGECRGSINWLTVFRAMPAWR